MIRQLKIRIKISIYNPFSELLHSNISFRNVFFNTLISSNYIPYMITEDNLCYYHSTKLTNQNFTKIKPRLRQVILNMLLVY